MKHKLLKANRINRNDFFEINERDVLFITNPGRMNNIDGSTFIINTANGYKAYYIDGWYFHDKTDDDFISYSEAMEHFPNWRAAIGQMEDKRSLKYRFIYMGFGNGLCVRKDIYEFYIKYLNNAVDQFAKEEGINDIEKEEQKYSIIYNVWTKAVVDMFSHVKISY